MSGNRWFLWAVRYALLISTFAFAGCGGGGSDTKPDGGPDGGGDIDAPEITSTPPLTATVGETYSYQMQASGDGTIAYAKVSGPGSIDSATGLYEWTPDAPGEQEIVLRASNEGGGTDQTFEVTVSDAPPEGPEIVENAPNWVFVETAYNWTATVTSTSGEVTWSVSSIEPDNVSNNSEFSINATSGEVSWTPTSDGNEPREVEVTVAAENSEGGVSHYTFVITVLGADAAPKITSDAPSGLTALATVDVLYTYSATAAGPEGVELVWSVQSGVGAIDPDTGAYTYTAGAGDVGDQTVTIRVARQDDSLKFDEQTFILEVGNVPSVTPIEDLDVCDGAVVNQAVAATPAAGVSFITTQPSGASFDEETQSFTWDTTGQGGNTETFTVQGSNKFGIGPQESFDVNVLATCTGPVTITSAPPSNRLCAGAAGSAAWNYPASASGAPVINWSLSSEPSGLTIEGATSGPIIDIAWDPVGAAGTYNFDLVADNGATNDTQQITVQVDPSTTPDVVEPPNPQSTPRDNLYTYDFDLIGGQEGVLPISWSLENPGGPNPFPTGMTIDANGTINWTPSANGTYSFRVRARHETCGLESTVTVTTLNVVDPPADPSWNPSFPCADDSLIEEQNSYSCTLNATGNPAPSYCIDAGTPLPSGLALVGNSISGVPNVGTAGVYLVTVYAANDGNCNGAGSDANGSFTITVLEPPPTIVSITPGAARRQYDIDVTVRGVGFDCGDSPSVGIRIGAGAEETLTNMACVDDKTLTARVPGNLTRTSGVHDVIVHHGNKAAATLSKRLTVTSGSGTSVTGTVFGGVWSAANSPYILNGNVTVNTGTLTIEPGAVVMFNNARYITVGFGSPGGINADGGVPGTGDQIVFTRVQDGTDHSADFGRGLRLGGSTTLASTRIANTVFEFLGSQDNEGAIYMDDQGTTNFAPVLVDSIIRESEHEGMRMQDGVGATGTTWFNNNWFSRNGEFPVYADVNDIPTWGSGLSFDNNGLSVADTNYIFANGQNITRATATLRKYQTLLGGTDIPYYMDDGLYVQGGSLTVQPGVDMVFRQGQSLIVGGVGVNGTLIADAASEAITMKAHPASSSWNGVQFQDDTLAGSVLRNVDIQGIADDAWGIYFDNHTPGVVTIDNCRISSPIDNIDLDAQGVTGVHITGASEGPVSFTNNDIDVRDRAIDVPVNTLHTVLGLSNTYRDSTNGLSAGAKIYVRSATMTGKSGISWVRTTQSNGAVMPFEFTGDVNLSTSSLTIGAGIQMEFPDNAEMNVDTSVLTVNGTALQPVIFRSINPGTVFWDFIDFLNQGAENSSLTYVEVHDAGQDFNAAPSRDRAAVRVRNSAKVEFANTVVSGSQGFGISFYDGSDAAGIFTGNTIEESQYVPVYIYGNHLGSLFTGNDTNTYTNNNLQGVYHYDGIYVVGDTVETTQTWPATNVPLRVHGDINVGSPVGNAVLYVSAGAEVLFRGHNGTTRTYDDGLRVGSGSVGALVAVGTPGNPVVFSVGEEGSGEHWEGLHIHDGTRVSQLTYGTSSQLDYVEIRWGGRDGANYGNLNFYTGTFGGAQADVLNVTFDNSQHYAATLFTNGGTPSLLNVQWVSPGATRTYTNNASGNCVRDNHTGTCSAL